MLLLFHFSNVMASIRPYIFTLNNATCTSGSTSIITERNLAAVDKAIAYMHFSNQTSLLVYNPRERTQSKNKTEKKEGCLLGRFFELYSSNELSIASLNVIPILSHVTESAAPDGINNDEEDEDHDVHFGDSPPILVNVLKDSSFAGIATKAQDGVIGVIHCAVVIARWGCAVVPIRRIHK